MFELLEKLDQDLFLFLNSLHNSFFDVVMAIVTDKKPWIPFYGLIILFLFWRYGKGAFAIVVSIAITITLCDQFASGFCKPFFGRLRPCYNEEIDALVHLVGGCGGEYSFISSHAANTFGLASFMYFLLRKDFPHVKWMFLWAAIVSYSRVYVGVHFPADIIVGGLSGFLWGFLVQKGYSLWANQQQKKKEAKAAEQASEEEETEAAS